MAFVSALFGALVGFGLTVIVQSMMSMRNMDIAALNDHINLINSIESLAVDYWLEDGEVAHQKELLKAARVRGMLGASLHFAPTAERLFGGEYSEFSSLDGELFDCATGGSFETTSRAADPERALSVMQACHVLRSKLREQRRKIFWAY